MQKAQLQHTETNKNEYRWGLRKKGKTVYNTCQRMAYCIAIGGALLLQPVTAQANPADGTVVSGAATFTSSGNTLEINQSTARAIIEWGSFDIQAGETTRFIQPSTSAIALNRVVNST